VPVPVLCDWLASFSNSSAYASLIERLSNRPGAITNSYETAMIYALIGRLRPRLALEIGTFFAATTRIMAEAIVDHSVDCKLVTIDPFGEHRVPAIINSWPKSLSNVTEFLPWNSMQYFLELETTGTPKGSDSPLGMVFLDGHHNFEYALYDMIRSADYLMPGGAIVIDDLDQEGPKTAVIQFLKWNPAWRMFCNGSEFAGSSADLHSASDWRWGVLVSPNGRQIAAQTTKLMKRGGISYHALNALKFGISHISHPGTLFANMCLYATPYDFHLTGEGLVLAKGRAEANVSGTEAEVIIGFPNGLSLDITRSDVNITYELELSYRSAVSDDAHLIFDPERAMTVVTASGAS
jgi:predicted O-methyltransferase YrrM